MCTLFRKNQVGLLLFWGLLVSPTLALADPIIYSNFNSNPSNLYASGGSYGVSNTSTSGYFESVAASFTATGNSQVTQLELAAQFYNNGTPDCPICSRNTNQFDLSLVKSSAGQPGSTVLFQGTIGDEPTTFDAGGICCSLLTVNLGTGVTIDAGQTYWLVAAPANGATTVLWQFNNVAATQPWSLNYSFVYACSPLSTCAVVPDPSGWTSQSGATPAFAVFGETIATPEPSTLALVVPGLLVLALLKLTGHLGTRDPLVG